MFRSINPKSLLVATSLLVLSTSVNAGILYRIAGPNAANISQLYSSFANLGGGIQHFDYDVSGTAIGANTGLWAAGTNTVTDSTGTYSHTFSGQTITGLSARNADLAYVTLDNGEMWRVGPVAANLTSAYSSFANLAGGIQHFDYDVSGTAVGANTGLWAAGTNTVTNNLGTISHTFNGQTITGLSARNADLAYVTLDNGELYRIAGAIASNISQAYSSFANLAGGIQLVDYDVSGTAVGASGFWAAGTDTVTNNLGTISHTFTGQTITGLSARNADLAYVLVSSPSAVPVPAAVWLMGSALMGLFGFQRKKKA